MPKPPLKSKVRAAALALGFRSGLEERVADSLRFREIEGFTYEQHTVPYTVPARVSRYTPDFVLPNGIVVETKGRWVTEDRQKIALVRGQYPDLDLRIVFQNPNAKISKASKTSYADICVKLGIPFAPKDIPTSWLKEPPNWESLAILERLRK